MSVTGKWFISQKCTKLKKTQQLAIIKTLMGLFPFFALFSILAKSREGEKVGVINAVFSKMGKIVVS